MFYLTADQHFYHQAVIEFSCRPFKGIEEMHECLIDNHNSLVKKGDVVYHLGDFMFGDAKDTTLCEKLLKTLHGQHFLIIGNHDRLGVKTAKGWIWTKDLFSRGFPIGHSSIRAWMSHFPLRSWSGKEKGCYNFHGHCHGQLENPDPLQIDVGVDCWDYKPVSVETLDAKLKSNRC